MDTGYNKDFQTQINLLEQVLLRNPVVAEILKLAPTLEMPQWYLGAGCVAQTIWNELHGFDPLNGMKDCDLVYYDSSNISSEAQDVFIERAKKIFSHLPLPVEIVNEARVHLWYEEECGKKIEPYQSVEEAMNEWPTTATGIGVRYDTDGKFVIFAPYGLNDLWEMIVRPNKLKITEEIYLNKVARWTSVWPKLKVIPWNN